MTTSINYNSIPKRVIDAAAEVRRYFDERNDRTWRLMGITSVENVDSRPRGTGVDWRKPFDALEAAIKDGMVSNEEVAAVRQAVEKALDYPKESPTAKRKMSESMYTSIQDTRRTIPESIRRVPPRYEPAMWLSGAFDEDGI